MEQVSKAEIIDVIERVAEIERDIKENIMPRLEQYQATQISMQSNVAEILAIVSGARKATTFITKHGPKLVYWGAGLFTAAGFGNPKVWAYLQAIAGG